MKLKDLFYEKVFNFIYLSYYSFKELLWDNVLSILKEVKNPSTWSAIFYILIIYAFWQGNLNLIKILLLPTIAIYLLRQKREGSYNRSLREKALLKNWKYFVDKEYEKYKKDCFFKKIESKEQDLWRLDEIAQIRKDNN